MNGVHQGWLVAVRELRERSRSRAFIASVIIMVLVVAGAIVLPGLLTPGAGTKDVGITGTTSADLPAAIEVQSEAVGGKARIHRYATLADGQEAVRKSDVDVLVVDGQELQWRRRADEQLKAVVTGAIQLVALQERAAAVGVTPGQLGAIVAPVHVDNVELGQVAGRSPDDETAAFLLALVLFGAITMYGAMVLSGVVEEKSSRVVEVLLARMPARNLLAGKIAGIGLLGLAQIALTALVAAVAVTLVDSFDIPAVRGAVLAWSVVWFVLGYALYATVFGVLGSLASRTEDASSVTGPVSAVLIVGYFVSFASIGSPDTTWALLVSLFPATAPFAMPTRIAMGAAAWWEPLLAVALTLATIAGLVVLGGRVYTGAILHTGPTLKLREAWRRTAGSDTQTATARAPAGSTRADWWPNAILAGVAAALIAAIYMITKDFIIGLAVGSLLYGVGYRLIKARSGGDQHAHR